jgi:hypothetical protein
LDKAALFTEINVKGIDGFFDRMQFILSQEAVGQGHSPELKKLEDVFFATESAIH